MNQKIQTVKYFELFLNVKIAAKLALRLKINLSHEYDVNKNQNVKS